MPFATEPPADGGVRARRAEIVMSVVLTENSCPDQQSGSVCSMEDEAKMETKPTDETMKELVQLFKLLADETRLRILFILRRTEEMNVLELCQELQLLESMKNCGARTRKYHR